MDNCEFLGRIRAAQDELSRANQRLYTAKAKRTEHFIQEEFVRKEVANAEEAVEDARAKLRVISENGVWQP